MNIGIIILFHYFMLLPGMEQPAVYETDVKTLEECLGMVAEFEYKVRTAMKTGRYQAGCQIIVPEVIDH